MLTLYAVKHQDKELFLPWVKGSNSKAELCDPKEHTPRLFKSYKGASQAMHAWAKGVQRGYGCWESADNGSYFELDSIVITPKKHRRLDEVCVVQILMYVEAVCH